MNVNEVGKISEMNFELKSSSVKAQQQSVSTFGDEVVSEKSVDFAKNPFNLYGSDIENFRFRGKDKYDAMRATNSAASEVNNMYNNFKKKYPDSDVQLESPPNPANYGKKRDGFTTYMHDLELWVNNCKEAIRQAEEEAKAKSAENKEPAAKNPSEPPAAKTPQQPETPPQKTETPKPKPTKRKAPPKKSSVDVSDKIRKEMDRIGKMPKPTFAIDIKEDDQRRNPSPPSYLIPSRLFPGSFVDTRNGQIVVWKDGKVSLYTQPVK